MPGKPPASSAGRSSQYEKDVLTFEAPDHLTVAQQALLADIVSLDHRSIDTLKPGTRARREVKMLLGNAITAGLSANLRAGGRALYERAESAYYHHLQSRNRITYLLGMVLGILVAALLGSALWLLAGSLSFVSPQLLILLFVFAGMGSIASVLTRLSSIDLRFETSPAMVLISGAARPIVASFFAIVVYLIIDSKLIDIQFGSPSPAKANGIYLVTSFLSGFSERFAVDILSRTPFAKSVPADQETPAEQPPK